MPKYELKYTDTTTYHVKARSEVEAKKVALKAAREGFEPSEGLVMIMAIDNELTLEGKAL